MQNTVYLSNKNHRVLHNFSYQHFLQLNARDLFSKKTIHSRKKRQQYLKQITG
jgi:hypothetical protein